jgi:tRNA 2-selenouridine synthase
MTTVSPILDPQTFLELSRTIPVIDVRAPKEFLQGHIPNAHSLPLFTDEERTVVGIEYARKGKDAALLRGLEIVGPKMAGFVEKARDIAPDHEILVHCWRGGMRSEAMAWLLQFAGIKTAVLEGGYRAYRRYCKSSFGNSQPLIVLGGLTGSGKTELLHQLSGIGEQVVDLERLANHKGSAFGALGQPDQPTNEQFENDLAAEWLKLDVTKPAWIEDESLNIGKVIIPELLFHKMAKSLVVFVDVPFDERVERLVREYGNFDKTGLSAVILKISKRIGGDVANTAVRALLYGDAKSAIAIVLKYYDKTYQYGLSKRDQRRILKLSYSEFQEGFAEIRRGLSEIRY